MPSRAAAAASADAPQTGLRRSARIQALSRTRARSPSPRPAAAAAVAGRGRARARGGGGAAAAAGGAAGGGAAGAADPVPRRRNPSRAARQASSGPFPTPREEADREARALRREAARLEQVQRVRRELQRTGNLLSADNAAAALPSRAMYNTEARRRVMTPFERLMSGRFPRTSRGVTSLARFRSLQRGGTVLAPRDV